jgi:hypothetical protein
MMLALFRWVSLMIRWRLRQFRTASPAGSARFSTCRPIRCVNAEQAFEEPMPAIGTWLILALAKRPLCANSSYSITAHYAIGPPLPSTDKPYQSAD